MNRISEFRWTILAIALFVSVGSLHAGDDHLPQKGDGTRTVEQTSGAQPKTETLPKGSFRSPSGIVWGPILKTAKGDNLKLTRDEAIDYCNGLKQSLPTKAQFERLALELGAPDNYDPAAVPDLRGNFYWSSTPYSGGSSINPQLFPPGSGNAWGFNGDNGHMVVGGRSTRQEVRCILASP